MHEDAGRVASPDVSHGAGGVDVVRIAAFDLDGTLLDGQSGTLVLRYLIQHKLVSPKATALAAWWGVRYKLHLPHRQSEVRELIFNDLRHLGPGRIEQIMRDFHDEVMIPRYHKDGIGELRRHQQAGERVVIISATFDQIAQAACEYLGVEAALATRMQRDAQGNFTGQVDGEVTAGPEKVRRIREYADGRFGPGGWRLVWAYGDHYTDIPMLELAENCRVVNPGPTLRREAARRQWTELEWS